MFSLKTFLEKVTKVQNEISEKLSSGQSTPESRSVSLPTSSTDCDLLAGSKLLNKYQSLWEELHKTTNNQSDSAVVAAGHIYKLHCYISRQDYLLSQLNSHLVELPKLAEVIEVCSGIVRETGLNLSNIQVQLDELERKCEKLEMERLKSVHRHHVNAYREERQRELKTKKRELERRHNENVKHQQQKECLVLQERSAIFGEEFEKDLVDFRKKGKLSVREVHAQPLDTLESFVPDDDASLNDFLNDNTPGQSGLQSLQISTTSSNHDGYQKLP